VILFFVLIVIVLIGLTAAAVMGKFGGFMAEPTSSQSFGGVPANLLSVGDIAQLHFDQALRGYRMDQVDLVIDALGSRLRELESEAASFRGADTSAPGAGELPDVSGQPQE